MPGDNIAMTVTLIAPIAMDEGHALLSVKVLHSRRRCRSFYRRIRATPYVRA